MKSAHDRANAKYNKAHTVAVTVRLHNENDKDIIELLNSTDNKQGLIKQLIRQAIKKEGQ